MECKLEKRLYSNGPTPSYQCQISQSAWTKNKIENLKATPADPENSSFKRDVLKMTQKLEDALNKEPNFVKHVYDTLCSVDLGYDCSLMSHLRFR